MHIGSCQSAVDTFKWVFGSKAECGITLCATRERLAWTAFLSLKGGEADMSLSATMGTSAIAHTIIYVSIEICIHLVVIYTDIFAESRYNLSNLIQS